MSRSIKLLAIAVAVLVLFALYSAQTTFAVPAVLDQQQTAITGYISLFSSPPAGSSQFPGQTFTAGLTGSLVEVDLAIACFVGSTGGSCASFGPVTVEIHSVSPTGALLGSTSLGPSAIPTLTSGDPSVFVPFIFSAPAAVVAGSVYAMVITATNADNTVPEYHLGESSGNPYAAGMEWVLS